jgi:DNA-binding Lrp family transcriptional regulator
MGVLEAWLNAAVREGFETGRSLADIAEETGLSESEVLRRGVQLKLIPQFGAALSNALANSTSPLH